MTIYAIFKEKPLKGHKNTKECIDLFKTEFFKQASDRADGIRISEGGIREIAKGATYTLVDVDRLFADAEFISIAIEMIDDYMLDTKVEIVPVRS